MQPRINLSVQIESVVIGASAGGVSAVLTLLRSLPADFPCSVMIVLHMPADRSSSLPRLFASHCMLPVKEAEDKEPIKPGTVYVAAPNYHLLVEPDKYLSLSMDEAQHYSRPSIDLLFESAAFAFRAKLLAILLTGANSDGAKGLAFIRQMNGMAWVQDPDEAEVPTMPAAAIKHAGADFVLSIADIAAKLRTLPQLEKQGNCAGHE